MREPGYYWVTIKQTGKRVIALYTEVSSYGTGWYMIGYKHYFEDRDLTDINENKIIEHDNNR